MRRIFSNRFTLAVSSIFAIAATELCRDARADVTIEDSGYSLEKNNPGDTTRISWTKMVALFNQYLSNAQQLNIFTSSCHSGGLTTAASS